jgi:hypothetical protein
MPNNLLGNKVYYNMMRAHQECLCLIQGIENVHRKDRTIDKVKAGLLLVDNQLHG